MAKRANIILSQIVVSAGLVFDLFFFFFLLLATYRGGTMVEETKREKCWERESQNFLGLEIGLEWNKWEQLIRSY